MTGMTTPRLARLVPALFIVAFAAAIVWWLAVDPPRFLERTSDAVGPARETKKELGPFWEEGTHRDGPGRPASLPGAWPSFRGPEGTNVLVDPSLQVIETWGSDGPRELWSISVAEGYSGAAIRNGRVYLQDHDDESRQDVVRCVSLADGEEIWRYSYPNPMKRNFGLTRTVPAVTEDTVVTIGPRGQVVALDAVAGTLRWALALTDRYGAEVPHWYMGQNPLVVEGRVILAPGGEVLMTALDEKTGDVIWETPNTKRWKMTHSSVTLAEFDGVRQLVYPASEGVVSVSVRSGEVLWEYLDWRVRVASVPAPVQVGGDRLLLTGGYGAGARMLRVTHGMDWTVRSAFQLEADLLGPHVHTPMWHRNLLFGKNEDHDLVCLDESGEVRWRSDKQHRVGLGPVAALNDHLFVLDEEGTLFLVRAEETGFSVTAEARVLDGEDAWAPMALAGGRLVLRDKTTMKCLEVASEVVPAADPSGRG